MHMIWVLLAVLFALLFIASVAGLVLVTIEAVWWCRAREARGPDIEVLQDRGGRVERRWADE